MLYLTHRQTLHHLIKPQLQLISLLQMQALMLEYTWGYSVFTSVPRQLQSLVQSHSLEPSFTNQALSEAAVFCLCINEQFSCGAPVIVVL